MQPGRIVCAAAVAAMLSGCANLLPGGEAPPPPRYVAPQLPAYALGEVIGGHAARLKAVRAAGIKPLNPTAVPNFVGRQELQLRQQTAGTGIDVIRSGNIVLVRLPASTAFDVGQATLRPQAQSLVGEIALTLKHYPQFFVDVLGHSDSTGNPKSNQALSERRAQSVAARLNSGGVAKARTRTRGYAAAHPIAGNDDETGRALNRRVEIRLVPIA